MTTDAKNSVPDWRMYFARFGPRERAARATGSRVDLDDARILLRDASGRVEIRSTRGKRVLTLREAEGKKTFEGPIATPEQRKAIPADVLPKVEALERKQNITFPKTPDNRDNDHEVGNDWIAMRGSVPAVPPPARRGVS